MSKKILDMSEESLLEVYRVWKNGRKKNGDKR